MAYLRSLDDMTKVLWAKSYLWDCRFPSAPGPFNEWFPAYTADETIFDIQDKVVTIGAGTFSLPADFAERDLKLNLYDDNRCTLETFFTAWRDEMFPTKTSVAPLASIVKEIFIAKLNNQREVTKEIGYWVRPTGQFFFQGNAESSVRSYNVTLKICGLVGKPPVL